jgi:hypothetical protein
MFDSPLQGLLGSNIAIARDRPQLVKPLIHVEVGDEVKQTARPARSNLKYKLKVVCFEQQRMISKDNRRDFERHKILHTAKWRKAGLSA